MTAFLLVDPRRDAWQSADDVTEPTTGVEGLRIGLVKDHAALYWPRVWIAAPEGGEQTTDASGSIAGLMARIDAEHRVWKAPAGLWGRAMSHTGNRQYPTGFVNLCS